MSADTKSGLHPRNRFRTRYDFPQLIACSPALAEFVKANAHGDDTIDGVNREGAGIEWIEQHQALSCGSRRAHCPGVQVAIAPPVRIRTAK